MTAPAAGTLFATHGGFGTVDTNLYTVDASTVALTTVGDTSHIFTGLAFDPTVAGTLYGVTGNQGSNQKTLFTVNTTTGAVTSIGALGDTVADICFDDAGQLYGWKPQGASSGNNRLTLINKATGGRTDRADSGITTNGCGISFLSGVLYLSPEGRIGHLYTVNTTSGAVTDVGLIGGFGTGGDYTGAMATRSGVLWGLGTAGKAFTIGAVSGGTFPITVVGTLAGAAWDSLAAMPGTGGGGLSAPEGVCVSFGTDALAATPVWTRLD